MTARRIARTALLAFGLLLFVSAAQAAPVTYVLSTPGVVWGGTSAKARVAVQQLTHVSSVESDMNDHTVTVAFDDEKLDLDSIVSALNDAGYVVKERTKVE